jgi:membrane-associated phospholipid phosphatase
MMDVVIGVLIGILTILATAWVIAKLEPKGDDPWNEDEL